MKLTKQELAGKVWAAANDLRGSIKQEDYKDFILGLMFYKFLSEREIETIKEDEGYNIDEEMPEDEIKEYLSYDRAKEDIVKTLGYCIEYEDLFSTWIKNDKDFSVKSVSDAIFNFNTSINDSYKHVYEDIFKVLTNRLSELGNSPAEQTKVLKKLIKGVISEIPTTNEDYDVLGFIYEDLLEKFATNSGGEFYTPRPICTVMAEIIGHHHRKKDKISVYDPASGSGGLLIDIGNSLQNYGIKKNNIHYYAQEKITSTYNLTRMNLIMHGVDMSNITTRNADTLEHDWPDFDENDIDNTYEPLFVDACSLNPPYSLKADLTGQESDPRFKEYGIPPKGKADYGFLLHSLYHLKSDGIMTIILPHGVLFRGSSEYKIRRELIDRNHIDAIIGFPSNMFASTGIPVCCVVLKKERKGNEDVLFIDASKNFEKVGKLNELKEKDIKRIIDTYIERKDVDKFSRKVSFEEIKENDYNLNIPRYVDSSEEAESYNLLGLSSGLISAEEIEKYNKFIETFNLDLFEEVMDGYFKFKTEDIKSEIDVKAVNYQEDAKLKIEGFKEIVAEMYKDLDRKEFFERLHDKINDIEFVDQYDFYQVYIDNYKKIAKDIEIIDKGKIKDFNETLFTDKFIAGTDEESRAIEERYENLETKINNSDAEMEEIFEELSDEDKEEMENCLNKNGTSFKLGELKKFVKESDNEELVDRAKKYLDVDKAKKSYINRMKAVAADFADAVASIRERLTEEQYEELLIEKWANGLMGDTYGLVEDVVSEMVSAFEGLADKYRENHQKVASELEETEKELMKLTKELNMSDADAKAFELFGLL